MVTKYIVMGKVIPTQLNNFIRSGLSFFSRTRFSTGCNNEPSKSVGKTYRDHILAETDLSRDHLTPEIQLYLITQNCRLWRARPEDSPFCEPFWAFYWPGGQALSRYLLDNKAVVKGKRVLDFGTGCGASGLAAKLSGAGHVTFNDIDPIAAEVVLLNGTENKIDIDNFSTVNLIGSCCQNFEVLLVGDMLYDTEFADEVLKWLRSEHEKGSVVFIGDPGRFALESHPLKSSLKCLAKYELKPSTVLENNGHVQAFVWTFK
ncbi:electron transfer flavoprotein beta subunit lysine methyltransferase-like isoform X2 [Macrobrachium nipponense]|uniref:electron transfer flavoprotein beta subunit lysine methyltransferase-like isoform X2 n=1 Tax=Macrobrachium nipponense TaxID=159736 RepID=UPI0030C867F4